MNTTRIGDLKRGDVIQNRGEIAAEISDQAGIPESEVADRIWLAVIDATKFDWERFAITVLFDQVDGETATIYLHGDQLVATLDA